MKTLKAVFKAFLAVLIAIVTLELGRYLGLLILLKLFDTVNLNADTYALAPGWLRYAADNTDSITGLIALLMAFAVLLILRGLLKPEKRVLTFSHIFMGLFSGALSLFLIRLLTELDCIRVIRPLPGWDIMNLALVILTAAVSALLIRGCVCEILNDELPRWALVAVSAVLQAGLFSLMYGRLNPVLLINSACLGAAAAVVYTGGGALYCEICAFGGFLAAERCLPGRFPSANVYSVSSPLITGGDCGLEASLTLTLVILLLAVLFVVLVKGAKSSGKKASVHR